MTQTPLPAADAETPDVATPPQTNSAIPEGGSSAEAGDDTLALVSSLTAEATAAAAGRLAEIADSAGTKEVRKAARRALYLLGQRGVLPARQEEPRAAAPGSDRSSSTVTAWASAFDGAGNRLLLFGVRDQGGGATNVVQILGNDEKGVQDVSVDRRHPRNLALIIARAEARLDEGLAFAEIEPEYARYLLDELREINRVLSTRTPAGLLDLLPRLGPASEPSAAPVRQLENEPDSQEDTEPLPTDPEALFSLPWFDPWFFAVEEVGPWIDRWLEIEQGAIVSSAKAKQDRRLAIAREAAAGLLTDQVRRRYVNRLVESADVLRRRGLEHAARLALLHARSLDSTGPVETVPFAVTLAARTLDAAAEIVRDAETRAAAPPAKTE